MDPADLKAAFLEVQSLSDTLHKKYLDLEAREKLFNETEIDNKHLKSKFSKLDLEDQRQKDSIKVLRFEKLEHKQKNSYLENQVKILQEQNDRLSRDLHAAKDRAKIIQNDKLKQQAPDIPVKAEKLKLTKDSKDNNEKEICSSLMKIVAEIFTSKGTIEKYRLDDWVISLSGKISRIWRESNKVTFENIVLSQYVT